MEEIVVTTRRREERLQDVPIAVNAITADQIQNAGVRQLEDVAKLSPSLTFNESFSQNDVRISVRGLTNTRGRSNVAFLVDGIDVTSETTGTNAGSPLLINQRLLSDIERIEVVRGPQSALYGRAAFAGAINYVSRDPGGELAASGSLDMADDGAYELTGGLSGPIGELPLGFTLSGVYWTDDGHYDNVISGVDFGGGDGRGLAAALVFEPSDVFRLKARVTWSDDEYAPRPVVPIEPDVTLQVPQEAIDGGVTSATEASFVGRLGGAAGFEARASEDALTGDDYPGNELEVWRGTLVASWDLGPGIVSSYTGLTRADLDQRYELDRQADGRPDTFLANGDVDTIGDTEQFSQELRFASQWEAPLQLTLGALYWAEDREDRARNIVTGCVVVGACDNLGYSSWQQIYLDVSEAIGDYRNPTVAETDHWSIYALLEWQLADSWKLSLEDRYVDEDFYAEIYIGQTCANLVGFSLPGGEIGCAAGDLYADEVNTTYHAPKVTLEWQATDDALVYFSAARGVKPGGISLLTVPLPFPIPSETFLYEPEKLWAYELGAKTTWRGDFGSLLINSAIFYNDYSDKQTNTTTEFPPFPIAVPRVTNASSARVVGLEIETLWQTPIEGLQIGLGYTWLDSEFEDFIDPTRSSGRIAIAGGCSKVENVGALPHCFLDLSGNNIEAAPENTLVATLSYARSLPGADWGLFGELNTRYQDELFTSQDNFTKLDSYWLTDLRLGIENDRWRLIFYVDNLFDDDNFKVYGGNPDFGPRIIGNAGAVGSFETTGLLPEPRTFGVRIGFRY